MAIANLAMATGNIGREGVGVNPLRGQNNVQGSCDMGSFPHEFSGYRHVTDDAARETFEHMWGVPLSKEPGLRIPNMIDEAIDGSFKWLYVQGEDIAQSDPDTTHITAGLRAMECVIVQDLFLNETARYAHVFLPGASFLEKDGTFINAERRISRVRKAIPPLAGMADWEATMALANAIGVPMHYNHPSEIMDEIAATTPTFKGVSYARLDELGSIQWPCNDAAPTGTPVMHVDRFVRGKGQFMLTEYVATEERVGPRFPLLLTTGRILSQYNVGAQTRRTASTVWHDEDVLEIHPFDAEQRGVRDGDLVALVSRTGEIALHAKISERMQPGVVYTTFHHAGDRRKRGDDRLFRLGDELPRIQGDGRASPAHQPLLRLAAARPRGGRFASPDREGAGRCGGVRARVRSTFQSAPIPMMPAPAGRSSREPSPSRVRFRSS